MKLGGGKIGSKPVIALILLMTIISISFFIIEPISAANIEIHPSSYYNTTHISLNDQIQKIISSAKNGDTITFVGKYYGELSLIINKSLNIISYINTTVSGDSTGQPVFLISGSGSKWTNITGFNIKSTNDGISVNNTSNVTIAKNNVSTSKGTGIKVSESKGVTVKNNNVTLSQTGISIANSNNSNIKGNNVKKSVKNGVEIENSHNVNVSNNNISSSGKHGASIANSENIGVEGNDMEYNQNNGINLVDTKNIVINNNTISNNNVHGIYCDNVKNTQITQNKIINNIKYGIELFGHGAHTKIHNNQIAKNAIGIDINSATDYLDISLNDIIYNKGNGDDSGVGINFGSQYVASSTLNVNYNAIFGNQRREVCAGDSNTKIDFGYNWYGSDDPREVRLCPYLTTKWITWKSSESNGKYSAVFYAGDQVASMLSGFDVTFQLNDGTQVTVAVQNGTATTSFPSSQYQSTGNIVTIKAIFQTIKMAIADAEAKNIQDHQDQTNNGGTGNNGNGGNGSSDSNGNGDGNGNGGNGKQGNTAGSGTSGPGAKSGQSGSTTGSDSSGSTKLVRNSAILAETGETGQSSSSQTKTDDQQSKTAQEILLDNVNNPNLWSVIGLVLMIIAIVVVYYRREIELMCRK